MFLVVWEMVNDLGEMVKCFLRLEKWSNVSFDGEMVKKICANARDRPDQRGRPLASDMVTTYIAVKTFVLKMAQVKAGIWP